MSHECDMSGYLNLHSVLTRMSPERTYTILPRRCGTAASLVVTAPATMCAADPVAISYYPVANRGKPTRCYQPVSAAIDPQGGRPLNLHAERQFSGQRDKRGICW